MSKLVANIAFLSTFQIFHQVVLRWFESVAWLNQTFHRVFIRAFDIVIPVVLSVILTPLLVFIALKIKQSSPGPILFHQQRYGQGRNKETFTCLKFRTMHLNKCNPSGGTATLKNDPRVFPFGAWLRKNSLDELPQLFNVFMGDMSLVGPRAHPVTMTVDVNGEQLVYERAEPAYHTRHVVKPGITGLAQVNGIRNYETLGELHTCLDWDTQFIQKRTVGQYLWICLKTPIHMRSSR